MESNAFYYRRRAVEERMAAQRSITEQARAWHSKLAEDFAAYLTKKKADTNAFYVVPAGGVDLCSAPVPVRRHLFK